MSSKLPNGLVLLDVDDSADPRVHMGLVRDGVLAALGSTGSTTPRAPLQLRVVDLAERDELVQRITLIVGDTVEIVNERRIDIWNGSAWKVWNTLYGFVYNLAPLRINNAGASVSMVTSVNNGLVRLSGSMISGATATFQTGQAGIILPFKPSLSYTTDVPIGSMHYYKEATQVHYQGTAFISQSDNWAALFTIYNGNGGSIGGGEVPLTSTAVSGNFGAGSILSFDLSYMAEV